MTSFNPLVPLRPPIGTPLGGMPLDGFRMTAAVSKNGSTIPTPTGTIQVRPYRSSSSSQIKALVTFTPRHSGLDRENTTASSDEFRGFYSLFWIGLFLLFCRTSLQSWEDNRTILSGTFGRLITGDALVLALSDFILVLSAYLCVPFVQALKKGWFRYYWTGLVIQHLFQTVYLGMACWWGYHRNWYWVQAGFLVLHALATLMKIHSYCAHNGMLSDIYWRLQSEQAELDSYLASLPDGGAAIVARATAAQKQAQDDHAALERKRTRSHSEALDIPIGTPKIPVGSVATSTGYITHADSLRLRLNQNGGNSKLNNASDGNGTSTDGSREMSPAPSQQETEEKKRDPHVPLGTSLEPVQPLNHRHRHPNPHVLGFSEEEHVSQLAKNIDLMKDELQSNGDKGIVWPDNVTYFQFFEFMLFPTLVYQLEYPRTKTMRPMYVVEKVFATFGVFSLIYTITEHYIMPFTPKPRDALLKSFVNLALPMAFNYLLIFYIIFECICNGFAELSYFADREFYQDWWNSTSWDQFARKWNKPVHTFLLRHVYASTISTYRFSRLSATMATFLLSALCHELVMAVVTKKIRMYLFLMQMAQVPMMFIGKIPAVKRNKTIGNVVFWMGLMCGFPLLAIAYLVY